MFIRVELDECSQRSRSFQKLDKNIPSLLLRSKMSHSSGSLYREGEEGVSVELTNGSLNPLSVMAEVKSPKAGAIVLFAGPLLVHTYHWT